jgi:signal transduction histidine kinase
MLGVCQDITERVETEARLRQAQKMETLGTLTGGIAHDFNNLLTLILGNLDLARTLIPENDRSAPLIADATKAAERSASLVERLLAFSRRQELRPEPLDLAALLAGLQDTLERTIGKTVDITIDAPPGTWRCVADENQLENTILNLTINARDAMPDGGRLELAVRNEVVDARQAKSLVDARPGEYVMLSVRDTGVGMPEHVRQRVFEPFFTTKSQGRGTGLGLSMVYGFVTQSGGFLHIDSRTGRGTEFQVYLPRAGG